jgi:signal transduction histidine kinase
MEPEVQSFVIYVCGALITLLLTVVGFLTSDRVKAKRRQEERKDSDQLRKEDLLEKRLRAGSENMAKQNATLEKLNERIDLVERRQMNEAAEYVRRSDFAEYRKTQEKIIREIRQEQRDAREQQAEQSELLAVLAKEIKTGLATVTALLAGKIEIPNEEIRA